MRRGSTASLAALAILAVTGCSILFGVDEAEFSARDAGLARDGEVSRPSPDATEDAPRGDDVREVDDGGPGTYLFVLGGSNDDGRFADVYSARITSTGMPDAFRAVRSLPEPIEESAVFASGDRIFVIGGLHGKDDPSARVFTAKVLPLGELGAWSELPSLPSARRRHGLAVVGTRVFVSGGVGVGNYILDDVLAATLTSDGLTGWATVGRLDEGTYAHGSFALGDRLVVVGGQSDVERTQTLAYDVVDGALGAMVPLAPLPVPTSHDRAAVIGGVPFLVGGVTDAKTSVVAFVRFGDLAPDGSLRGWERSTDIANGRWLHGFVASADYLYVVAGHGPQNEQRKEYDDVLVGRVRSNHSVDWQTSPRFLPHVLAGHGIALATR